MAEKSKQIQAPARPVKVIAVNRRFVRAHGKTYDPGSEIEIVGQDQIAHVGLRPSPKKFARLDLYHENGSYARFSSASGAWEQVDHDATVELGKPDVVPTPQVEDGGDGSGDEAKKSAAKKG